VDGPEHSIADREVGRTCISMGRAQPATDSSPSKDVDHCFPYAPVANESV